MKPQHFTTRMRLFDFNNLCFCSKYDENRQTMFYCGFFSTLAGFLWLIIGFGLKCAFFSRAFGPSVNAVACGIMIVGLMVLVAGLCFTLSVVCTGRSKNKTECLSSSGQQTTAKLPPRLEKNLSFDSPSEVKIIASYPNSSSNASSGRGSFDGSLCSSSSSASSSSTQNQQQSFSSKMAIIS